MAPYAPHRAKRQPHSQGVFLDLERGARSGESPGNEVSEEALVSRIRIIETITRELRTTVSLFEQPPRFSFFCQLCY